MLSPAAGFGRVLLPVLGLLQVDASQAPSPSVSQLNSTVNRIGVTGLLTNLIGLPDNAANRPDAKFMVPLPEVSFPISFPSFTTVACPPTFAPIITGIEVAKLSGSRVDLRDVCSRSAHGQPGLVVRQSFRDPLVSRRPGPR